MELFSIRIQRTFQLVSTIFYFILKFSTKNLHKRKLTTTFANEICSKWLLKSPAFLLFKLTLFVCLTLQIYFIFSEVQ